MNTNERYRIAVAAVVTSAILNSGVGVLVRQVEAANEWQIIAVRGLGVTFGLTLIFGLQERGRIREALVKISPWLLMGGVFQTAASICYIHAIQNTTIANTLFIQSAAPFATAILAWLCLKETLHWGTWGAMLIATAGITLMVSDGISQGTGFGNIMALGSMLFFSAFVVVLRFGRTANMLPVVLFSWVISFGIGTAMAGGDLMVPLSDFIFVLLWGAVLSPIVYALFTFGSRYVLGAEVSLLVQVEFILGPLLVWLIVNEEPTQMTLVGGTLVLAAVIARGIQMTRA